MSSAPLLQRAVTPKERRHESRRLHEFADQTGDCHRHRVPRNAYPAAEEPGRLEFRILADRRHDAAAVEKAKAADSFEHPPAGYRWVRFGQVVMGTVPKVEAGRLVVPAAHWKDNEFADREVWLKCQDAIRGRSWWELKIIKNDSKTLEFPWFPDGRDLRSVTSYQIDLTPRLGDLDHADGAVIRDFPEAPGLVLRAVLVRLDRRNLGERDLASIRPDSDERGFPAVAITFTGAGGKKLRALTTEHMPGREGGFFYRLGIILDGRLLSAPEIHGAVGGDSGERASSNWGRMPVPGTRSASPRSSVPPAGKRPADRIDPPTHRGRDGREAQTQEDRKRRQ